MMNLYLARKSFIHDTVSLDIFHKTRAVPGSIVKGYSLGNVL